MVLCEVVTQLRDILGRLEDVYRPNILAAESATPPLRPANDDYSDFQLAAEAIADAISALTRELVNGY